MKQRSGAGRNIRGARSRELDDALGQLDHLAAEQPCFAELAAVLRDVLPGLYEAVPSETVAIPDEVAAERVRSGTPLLRGEHVPINIPRFKSRWQTICRAAQRQQPAIAGIGELCEQPGWDPQQLTDEVLSGRIDQFRGRAEAAGYDFDLLSTVLRLALFPVLSHIASVVSVGTRVWRQGMCPTCGSWPQLAELRGLEQNRYLRCGLCASDWAFPRLECPLCRERDHRSLGYFHIEGEESRYRVATCETCQGYVKTVSTLSSLPGPQLLVVDLATMHLDLAARERGFRPVQAFAER